ncbi:MAG: 16S rRNA (guanine(966)-N(2))-methyltransferase RsmD [Sphaerochaeta sp.]|uniref:16S rRNA (guanine(966)-N(2))-methyltransferase RsmD n=1 Tax=unclassified Sphaerochaeta TaxID=2637943 RepID=UPI000B1F48D2|nr:MULTISPECIES: 16S rRNA (guanine(966)-N(2))-methyltransferase RsmD [unclassified Sphaerochaeta]MCK9599067.1 16S rRNA (guanine(966)-N(2))-methyltransferase RsmD [Sphaerochaeta sp.]MDX9824240.1 16S rRNA (guanine(966)-N(2))-methyltransferase RsmD [Sphaerochaeta sp.]MEA4863906.1 16S rRNA (guanine(966)-N(2))-methyltransferase RsmD [Sphaerochaeta sp.]HAP56684.1 16S rRNA (guanine(966)-N(2))-methyltransferase RsmD [Sphaerochaeta sp.]HBO35839.1 16S rRNA (guanine(966)-N(2))-methyltransferase RsmD [Sph
MRITGGIYRGRTVACPPGIIRPAMDMMRESLFSILGNLEGKSWLDLFTGSGCVGIEAASRGAAPVHLVEKDRLKKATIIENISMVESEITLFMADVHRFIPTAKRQYDIVYADPPFPMQGKVGLAQAVDKQKLLSEGGLFIIHYPSEEKGQWPEQVGNLVCYDQRKYGRSTLRFYKNTLNAGEQHEI